MVRRSMSVTPGTRVGPFEILSLIGAGGMGEVYRARDTRLNRDVAVKVLSQSFAADPDRLRRFTAEARSASALNHPHILAVYDIGTHDGTPYMVSELLEGESLRERLRGGSLSVPKAVELARQAASGLAAAHARGITHRDIKPENLFLTRDGHLKILDFGLAKLEPSLAGTDATQAETVSLTTTPGLVVGTVAYMSPEQVRGEAADHRSDIFSFGCVLYEMLSGRRPFQGATSVETMNAILKHEPPALAGVPPLVERIVRHCLEKSLDERFQSARDLAFQLQAALEPTGPQPAVQVPRWPRRRVMAAAGAAPVLAAASFWIGRRTAQRSLPSFRQLTFGRGSVWAARFAPDEQTIIYSARWDGNPPEVFSTRRESPESRSILANAELLSVSAGGQLALLLNPRLVTPFQLRGTLARMAISGGAHRELAENVSAADWEPVRGEVALVRQQGILELPAGQRLHRPGQSLSHVRFSRNGESIAFIQHSSNTNDGAVAVFNLRQERTAVLSDGWQSVWGLAWSPAGDEVWFTGSRDGRGRAIYAVTQEGRLRLLFRETGMLTLHDVARDRRMLLARDELEGGVLVIGKGVSQERNLAAYGGSLSVDLSSDGSAVLMTGTDQGTGSASVYLRKVDGSPPVRLGEGEATALSPDGKWALAIEYPSHTKLILHPTGPGQSRQIGSGFPYRWASWFSDSRRILAFASEPGKWRRLYVIDVTEGKPKVIAHDASVVRQTD